MADDITIERWLEQFRVLAEQPCRWPGPRPLRADDKHLLVGRDQTLSDFRNAVDDNRLVLLSGTSGVGKSSLLRAGLVPDLRKDRRVISVSSDWNWRGDEETAVSFLARTVRAGFGSSPPAPPIEAYDHPGQLFWELDETLGYKGVIVLDQFEELVRYSEHLARDIFEVVLDLNRETHLKIILSFRSEFLHYFRPIEDSAQPYTLANFALDPVHASFARDIVLAPFADDDIVRPTDDFVEAVVSLWDRSTQRELSSASIDPFDTTGLLHLQAFLWDAFFHARGNRDDPAGAASLAAEDFDRFERHLLSRAVWRPSKESTSNRDPAPRLFEEALNYSVELKLRLCEEAAEHVGIAESRLNAVRSAVTSIAPQLSSAGYKLVREVAELGRTALFEKLDVLTAGSRNAGGGDPELDEDEVGTLLYTLMSEAALGQLVADQAGSDDPGGDILNLDTTAICARADQQLDLGDRPPLAERLHFGRAPSVADPISVSAGRKFGSSPVDVLVQELRSFAFALTWMKESALVRVTAPEPSRLMISLIHDGFGAALNNWASDQRRLPRLAIWSDTALIGPNFDWWIDAETHHSELDGSVDGERIMSNLRWKGCWVHGKFRNITFVNSDFRGTIFDSCDFEGVTFVNCVLDGTIFSDCTVVGRPAAPLSPLERTGVPWFIVRPDERGKGLAVADIDEPAAAALRSDADATGAYLVAEPSDVLPDVPGAFLSYSLETAGLDVDASLEVDTYLPVEGGMFLIGGRLANLTFRNTTFSEGSAVRISGTQGTGLAIVEQVGGRWEIGSSAIRHLTVTPPLTRQQSSKGAEEGTPIHLTIRDSIAFQVWLGQGLKGDLYVTNSTLVQFWNQSDPGQGGQLESEATDTRVTGVRGVSLGDGCEPLIGTTLDVPPLEEQVTSLMSTKAALTDYRREG